MIREFLYSIFIDPIKYETSHNVVNIFVYGLLFFGFVYGFYKLLKKLKVDIDFKFYLSSLIFMFAGSLLRAMVDHNLYPRNFFTITPGIYAVFTFLFFFCFLASYFIEKKFNFAYWKMNIIFGVVTVLAILLPKVIYLRFENLTAILLCILLFSLISGAIYAIIRKFKLKYFNSKLSQAAIYSQVFDGVNTSVLMSIIGGFEKHPLPRFLINVTKTPFSFIAVKILLVFTGVYFVNKYVEEKDFKNALLITISMVGFAPGIRNLLSYLLSSVF